MKILKFLKIYIRKFTHIYNMHYGWVSLNKPGVAFTRELHGSSQEGFDQLLINHKECLKK